jgi:hypothetical protein
VHGASVSWQPLAIACPSAPEPFAPWWLRIRKRVSKRRRVLVPCRFFREMAAAFGGRCRMGLEPRRLERAHAPSPSQGFHVVAMRLEHLAAS